MKLQELNAAELRNINGGGLLDGLLGGGSRNDRNSHSDNQHEDTGGGLLDGLLGNDLLGGLLGF